DARRGKGGRVGVEVFPVDITASDWDNTLEQSSVEGGDMRRGMDDGGQASIRLGLRQVAGLSEAVGRRIVAARDERPFADVRDLSLRAALDEKSRAALAEAGALQPLAGHRHAARWAVAGIERQRPLLPGSPDEDAIELPAPQAGEDVLSDYRATGLTLREHPLALLRARLQRERVLDSSQLREVKHGRGVHAAGLVTQRQRPATAGGTIFVTLEDEHGMVNVVVWRDLALHARKALLGARLLAVRGRWEQVDGVQHLIARELRDISHLLGDLRTASRDFH
ncbi:MAG: error-prone DNA polymerase, partial [Variovorax sp.]